HSHAQVVQGLDGGVAGQEVIGTGAKGKNLQTHETQNGPGNGNELPNLLSHTLGGLTGVVGDVNPAVPQAQVVAGVEHTAVGVAAAVVEVAVTLGGAGIHDGAVEPVGDHGLGGLGAEVAQK